MSKRFDNRKLLLLLAGLAVLLALTVIVKIPKENATLKSRMVDIDTSRVSRIVLFPRDNKGAPVEFSRQAAGRWIVKQGDLAAAADKGAVQNMISEAVNIKPQSLATKDKAKWEEFELTDSLGTRVKFMGEKDKVLGDLMIGKFTYKQVNDPYGGYGGMGGGGISGTSYVRLYDEKEVYAAEGFLVFTFNGRFSDWRDKTFIRTDRNSLTNIRFTYPADSSFSLIKEGTAWKASNQPADSAAVANYLNALANLDGQDFKDGYKPASSPDYQLVAEGNNLAGFTIKCYKGEGPDEYILSSSMSPEVYFVSKKDGIFEKLFKDQKYFSGGK